MSDADAVLERHHAPPWFDDAKLGIFIHWGLFSVPGWAPADALPPVEGGLDAMRRGENAYAEWYANSQRIAGSPTAQWHAEHFGDAPYADFRGPFEHMLATWDPMPWADLFAASGARYVVLTTKHHDGYLMWPSNTPNPHVPDWQADRDIVGDLAAALQARDLRFGLYYSGGLDWTFRPGPIDSPQSMVACIPTEPVYTAYVDAHWRELIARYRPAVLWNDIAMPSEAGLSELLVDYLAAVPDGAINDRFKAPSENRQGRSRHFRSDFATPEYRTFDAVKSFKWETCRGVGRSFGYNRAETGAHHLDPDELIRMFVDVVAKGGNLLLNVGPTGDGDIPELQASRLRTLGAWLATNGDAIYGTRPWVRPMGTTREGTEVRFTQGGGALNVFVLGDVAGAVTIADVPARGDVTLLGHGAVGHEWNGDALTVHCPDDLARSPAHCIRIGP
jgi:alpha-L-fucosidase